MKSEIVAKLNRAFEYEILSESQVVYVLVETRKLLEQQNALGRFRALKLCSDWAVHPKLDRSDAQNVLGHFDAYEMEYQKSGLTVAEFQLKPLNEFLSHQRFREEFVEALTQNGVIAERLESDESWRAFVQEYSAVIQDCPLEAKTSNARLVSSVTCSAWPQGQAAAIFPGKRVIEWRWNLNANPETHRRSVCALI